MYKQSLSLVLSSHLVAIIAHFPMPIFDVTQSQSKNNNEDNENERGWCARG
jgi:hypothetical protein